MYRYVKFTLIFKVWITIFSLSNIITGSREDIDEEFENLKNYVASHTVKLNFFSEVKKPHVYKPLFIVTFVIAALEASGITAFQSCAASIFEVNQSHSWS